MIVLDASFLIAFHNDHDVHHASAVELMDRFLADEWGRGMLLEYVFLEVVTVLLLKCGIDVAAERGRILLEAREIEFLPCSELFLEFVHEFSVQRQTRLSFADVAIRTAARKYARGQIITFDAEFRKFPELRVYPDPPAPSRTPKTARRR